MILLSLIFFTAGALYTMLRWGVQKSVSITFYEHENKALWYLWFLSFTLPLLPLIDHWTLFIAIFSIMLVGVAPDFKSSRMEERVHIGGAYVGIIFAFIYLITQQQYIIPGIMAAFTGFAVWKLENKTHWIEIAALYLALLGIHLL